MPGPMIKSRSNRSREINTIYFDPDVITAEEKENALREAGTYLGIDD